ncbi:MAG: hypothetical protein CVU09_00375 [Bacteroidetes bacterium HGW-Bacteroidetes-4]|jgi:SWI/SNF-related matrix-associated actin-dependent regulator 1 of chromatin subfamily A|nr:MAG: hypothetical protein CVU09_00375 [Bacteroidetes bacterium HGW-Bacteroidetes-4]
MIDKNTIQLSHPDGYQPFPYQWTGINKGMNMKRFINGDDMGCGKTVQSIATAVALNATPSLVICPASLKINWKEEIEAWTDKKALILNNKHVHIWPAYSDANIMAGMFAGKFDFFIVNYESLKKFFVWEYLKKKPRLSDIVFNPYIRQFKSVIVDEAHKVKDPDSQQSKLVKGLCTSKEVIMLLTGTPVVNNASDLVAPLSILDRLKEFGGVNGFLNKFGANDNLDELQAELSRFYFRRDKKEVLPELPDKFRSFIRIDIDTKPEYNKAVDDLEEYFREYTSKTEFEIAKSMRGKAMVLIQTLKRVAAVGKIKAIREIVDNIIDSGQKIILFMELKELISEFKRIYPNAVTITGDDNYQMRDASVKKFQNDPDCKLILCSTKAAGVGLNLTAADNVGFVEYSWTYMAMVQAEDRAYRNGRKDNVNCLWFEGAGTIDQYVRQIIFGKKDIAEKATGAVDYTIDKAQDEVLHELIKNIHKLKL